MATASTTDTFSFSSLGAMVGPMLKALLPAQLFRRLSPSCLQEGRPLSLRELAFQWPPLQDQLSFQPPPPGPEGHVTYKVPLLSSAYRPSCHCFQSASTSPLSTPVPPAWSLHQLPKMECWQLLKYPMGAEEDQEARALGLPRAQRSHQTSGPPFPYGGFGAYCSALKISVE